ncbi:CD9 antigen-like [Tubulanus polymorphus]|uniref:CD9 antigen-like n=1 Tax=Tubulanus polymorphus TaxID=672921 RepID=UPI003DA4FAAE
MGLGSCYTCIKYLMFAFNFLFWLLGCAIIGVGIWLRVDKNAQRYAEEAGLTAIFTGAYVLIAVGCIIMVLGFLGCCGAIRESQCMLVSFFILLFIIFAVLLGAGIWAVVNKDSLKNQWGLFLQSLVDKYKKNQDPAANSVLYEIQEKFECCGVDSIVSYGITPPPPPCISTKVFSGCKDGAFTFINEKIVVIAAVGIGIGIVMIFGMIFSMMLCCAIRDTKG